MQSITIEYPRFPEGEVFEPVEGERVTIGRIVELPRCYVGAFEPGDVFVIVQVWRGYYRGDGPARNATHIRAVCIAARFKKDVGRVCRFVIGEEWTRETFLDR